MCRKTIALVVSLLAVAGAACAEQKQPNIIFINADDMGVGDVSHTTGLAPTPNIDRMAAEGMRFTDAHTASAVCTPSRYALLTGRYNWRTRLTAHVFSNPDCAPLIEPDEPTIATLLSENGYHTACIGKWHLGIQWQYQQDYKFTAGQRPKQGWDIDFSKPAIISPISHGFDYFWGIAASLDMPPYLYIENKKAVTTELVAKKGGRKGPMDIAFKPDGCLQSFAEKSVAYIDERAKEDQPFFLYLPLSSPHSPVVPSDAWKGKSGLGRYGDFLMETDWVVGQVLAALDKHGLAENTLVIFSTDNGCSNSAGIPNLIQQGHNPCGGLRGHKADIYEGGHRVPFVVRWPALVKPNTVTSRLTCQTDFISTCADILGVELAANSGVDSVSFLPTLKDPSKVERDAVVHHSINGSFAIREGDWKLILCKGSGGWTYPKPGDAPAEFPDVQLFNLAEDLGETNNLQAEYPERVTAMTEVLKRYVENGRSTEGPAQNNATEVNIYALPIKR
ncbi:arylsulfatase [Pontiellaceae bacterium B12219]|nr:arylsulfatase [Pontiellaceae bacterium B12219]